MEQSSLLAFKLHKLARESGDSETLADTIRQLLELDRAGHAPAGEQGSSNVELFSGPLMRLLPNI